MDPATPFVFFLVMAWYWLLWLPLFPLTIITAAYFRNWKILWIGLIVVLSWMLIIFQYVKWY